MSWWGDRRPPETKTGGQLYASGPLADLGDVTAEAYRAARVTYNLNAEQIAGEVIYDRVIEQVQKATGDNLQNPYRQSFREKWIDTLGPSLRSPYNPRRLAIVRGRDDFQLQYWKLQQQQIDMGVPFEERLPDFDFQRSVQALVREREAQLADVAGRASDFDAFTGQLAGDFGAMVTDPSTYLVSAIPFGASKSVLGATVKGVIGNAAIEAGLQAPVAQWHKELGLDYTAGEAVMNIAFAGLFGGVLEGGGTALYWGARGTPEYRTARRNLEKLPEDHILRQALSGKRKDVIAAGRKIKDYLTPDGRLAFTLEEARARTLDDVPQGASPRAHEDAVAQAVRAAEDETPPQRVTEKVESDRAELQPYLSDELADTPRGRDARDLARLSDDAYAQVKAGRITPEQGAEIARLVPDGRLQREIAEDLAELGPLTPEQSRVVIGVGLEARAPDAAAKAMGWEGPPPQRPQSIVDWVRSMGGIRSDKFMTGNARQLLGGDGRQRPGLINESTGMHLDLLAREAESAGFDVPGEDPEILLRLIDDELSGIPHFRIGATEEWRAYHEGVDSFDPREQVRAFADELRASPDPQREALGTSFEDALGEGDLTPDDIELLRPRGEDPRDVADFRAEADAIDALRADTEARARIREEAEAAFGPDAARIIADDPGTDEVRVYLFQKNAEGGQLENYMNRIEAARDNSELFSQTMDEIRADKGISVTDLIKLANWFGIGYLSKKTKNHIVDVIQQKFEERWKMVHRSGSPQGQEAQEKALDAFFPIRRDRMFQRSAAQPRGELTPITLSAIKEDAQVLRTALMEAAACAAGYPILEGALTVAGAGLLAGAAGGVVAQQQEASAARDAEERAARAQRRAEAEDPRRQDREEARRAHEKHKAIAGLRTEAHRLHTDFRKDTLAMWSADIDQMPDFLPQYRVNAYVQGMTGIRADFLDRMLTKESGGDWTARPVDPATGERLSTAYGGFQFLERDWLNAMRLWGGRHGFDAAGKTRAEILEMRSDPRWGTIMAAHLARDNAQILQRSLGRPATQREAYLAHFAGVAVASRLISAPADAVAAKVAPAAASSNPNVFYRGGNVNSPRTVQEVRFMLTRQFPDTPLMVPGWQPPEGTN